MSEEDDMSHSKSNDEKRETEAITSETLSGTRQRTLTEKGKDWSLAQLKGKRQTLTAQLTTKSKAISSLFESYENRDVVKESLIEWNAIYNSFIEMHRQYYLLLSEELKGSDSSGWFEPKDKKHQEFKVHVEQWLLQAAQYLDKKRADEALGPSDSISQAGSRQSSRCGSKRSSLTRSKISLRSYASSISSARLKEEARKAELLARSALLRQKQALEDEELRVRRMKEGFTIILYKECNQCEQLASWVTCRPTMLHDVAFL